MDETADAKVHGIRDNNGGQHVVRPSGQMHLLGGEIIEEVADKICFSSVVVRLI